MLSVYCRSVLLYLIIKLRNKRNTFIPSLVKIYEMKTHTFKILFTIIVLNSCFSDSEESKKNANLPTIKNTKTIVKKSSDLANKNSLSYKKMINQKEVTNRVIVISIKEELIMPGDYLGPVTTVVTSGNDTLKFLNNYSGVDLNRGDTASITYKWIELDSIVFQGNPNIKFYDCRKIGPIFYDSLQKIEYIEDNEGDYQVDEVKMLNKHGDTLILENYFQFGSKNNNLHNFEYYGIIRSFYPEFISSIKTE